MKNLINKVLVVLTVSAIFAGNIDAARDTNRRAASTRPAAAPTKNGMTDAQMALDRLGRMGAAPDTSRYTLQNKLDDIATVRNALPKDSGAIAKIEAAVKVKDAKSRRDAFKPGSAAVNACAELTIALATANLDNANKQFDDKPTEANAVRVAEATEKAKANVAVLDDTAASGWKGYVTKKNILYTVLGVASVIITGYVMKNGAPEALKPYISPESMVGRAYNWVAESTLGGVLGSAAGYAKTFGAAATNYGRSALETATFGYLGSRAVAAATALTGETTIAKTVADQAKKEADLAKALADKAKTDADLAQQTANIEKKRS